MSADINQKISSRGSRTTNRGILLSHSPYSTRTTRISKAGPSAAKVAVAAAVERAARRQRAQRGPEVLKVRTSTKPIIRSNSRTC